MTLAYRIAFTVTVASGIILGIIWVLSGFGTPTGFLATIYQIALPAVMIGGVARGVTYAIVRARGVRG